MTTEKKLGIWMDHSSAHLIEFPSDPSDEKMITSKFTHQQKEESLAKSENGMHHKQQHGQAEYYKKLGEVIKQYDQVLLFGPTHAKTELFNTIKDDQHFGKIKINVEQSDKLTENQQHAFVRDYFKK
jgi:ADP-heptose:LPS heptosyltransferase